MQLTDGLLTNTEQITVSAKAIKDDTEVLIGLYNADDFDTPIRTATLTANNNSVDFTGLSSRFEYKVGASIESGSSTVLLTISD